MYLSIYLYIYLSLSLSHSLSLSIYIYTLRGWSGLHVADGIVGISKRW